MNTELSELKFYCKILKKHVTIDERRKQLRERGNA